MPLSETGRFVWEHASTNLSESGRWWFGNRSEVARFGWGFGGGGGGPEPPPEQLPGEYIFPLLGVATMQLFGRTPLGQAVRKRIPDQDYRTQANGVITGNFTGPNVANYVEETSDTPNYKTHSLLYYNGTVSAITLGYGVAFESGNTNKVVPIKTLTGAPGRKFWFVRGFTPTGWYHHRLTITQTGSIFTRRAEV